jgi:hypothetical protein
METISKFDSETTSNIGRSVGAGLLTLVFLGGVGYLMYVALFSAS